MIRESYIFLDKIGPRLERSIWEQGICCWDDFLAAGKVKGISPHRKSYYDRMLLNARKRLYTFDSSYFHDILPSTEHWRLYRFFREECCFLDIETSSVQEHGYITVVGLFDGTATKTMVRGINLDFKALQQELSRYKMIVSFNGRTFDQPFLEKHSPLLLGSIPHFDLRHACSRIGLKGGLKQIEQQLGIRRDNAVVERMYGGDPLRLWKMYRASGDEYYLHLLVEYNEEDVINLQKIAEHVYAVLSAQYGGTRHAPASDTAHIPLQTPLPDTALPSG